MFQQVSNLEMRQTNVKRAIIFSITLKANKDWYFNTHLTYLFEIAYWLLAYSWIFRWEIFQSWCNSMSYGIFINSKFFFDALCPVIATFVNAFIQLFNNFFFFLIRKTRLHSWYHFRTFWCTIEIFGDDRHFDLLLQLCSPFLFWSFTPNTKGTEIRIFECSSKGMHRWEKKDETAALQKSFGRIF